ncbi:hypothetical protein EVAR_57066_1 [Eumeta japonica]|uniref:Uncharacterized protein n=1 Tax=Eumeta variegata TaxID=151549 RepID=A0A4C1Y5K3_EUMVA|nr:hypothetical protein EVAR_57066_1 [Eumeta japonica]
MREKRRFVNLGRRNNTSEHKVSIEVQSFTSDMPTRMLCTIVNCRLERPITWAEFRPIKSKQPGSALKICPQPEAVPTIGTAMLFSDIDPELYRNEHLAPPPPPRVFYTLLRM